jgi:hypothetical protein
MPPYGQRTDLRPQMPARVLAAADEIGALLKGKLESLDPEVARCALLELSQRLKPETENVVACRGRARGHYGR